MKVKILKRDFDNAVKQAWDAETCLLAQAGMRQGIHPDGGVAALRLGWIPQFGDLMVIFDRSFRKPGDERKEELQTLRAKLPVVAEYTP